MGSGSVLQFGQSGIYLSQGQLPVYQHARRFLSAVLAWRDRETEISRVGYVALWGAEVSGGV